MIIQIGSEIFKCKEMISGKSDYITKLVADITKYYSSINEFISDYNITPLFHPVYTSSIGNVTFSVTLNNLSNETTLYSVTLEEYKNHLFVRSCDYIGSIYDLPERGDRKDIITVLVDIDGVLADQVTYIGELVQQYQNEGKIFDGWFNHQDWQLWDLEEEMLRQFSDLDDKEVEKIKVASKEIWKHYAEVGLSEVEPFSPNIGYYIDYLKYIGCKIIIWTARKESQVTMDWLAKHNINYDDIMFEKKLPDHWDVAIEDGPHVIKKLYFSKKMNQRIICIDRPWNKELRGTYNLCDFRSCIYHASDFTSVTSIINEIINLKLD